MAKWKAVDIQEFLRLIDSARAVLVDDYALSFPVTENVIGNPENVVLYVSWEDDGIEHNLEVTEETIRKTGAIEHGEDGIDRLVFEDENEGYVHLMLLHPMKLIDI